MKTSIVITTYNEEHTISALLDSLSEGSLRPNEIIIIDSKSQDKTTEIIRHYQKKNRNIKLLLEKCTRGRGRNLGVELSRNEIIAMTDAGCTVQKDWLKRLTSPFESRDTQVVAGFYKMTAETNFQGALAVFLGVMPKDFSTNYLPSTRSIAFRKGVWEQVGGFPDQLNCAEDTVFNQRLLKHGVKIHRMKSAKVEWGIPTTLKDASYKFYSYAKGDAKSKVWVFKLGTSHNIKVLLIYIRYLLAFVVLCLSVIHPPLLYLLFVALLLYICRSFRKVYKHTESYKSAKWGPFIQILSDFSVMAGFAAGTIRR